MKNSRTFRLPNGDQIYAVFGLSSFVGHWDRESDTHTTLAEIHADTPEVAELVADGVNAAVAQRRVTLETARQMAAAMRE